MIVSQGFDGRQFQQFARDLEAVGRAYGKSHKKFLRQEGSKLLRKTKARARALVLRSNLLPSCRRNFL